MRFYLLALVVLGFVGCASSTTKRQPSSESGKNFSLSFEQQMDALYPKPNLKSYLDRNDLLNYDSVGRARANEMLHMMRFDFVRQNNVFDRMNGWLESQSGGVFKFQEQGYTVSVGPRSADRIQITWQAVDPKAYPREGSFFFLKQTKQEESFESAKATGNSKVVLAKETAARDMLFGSIFGEANSQVFEMVLGHSLAKERGLRIAKYDLKSFDEFRQLRSQVYFNRVMSLLPLQKMATYLKDVANKVSRTGEKRDTQRVYSWHDIDRKIVLEEKLKTGENFSMDLVSQALKMKVHVDPSKGTVLIRGIVDRTPAGVDVVKKNFEVQIENGEATLRGDYSGFVDSRVQMDLMEVLRQFRIKWWNPA